jgi:AmiR/NasT family two-component response regulator
LILIFTDNEQLNKDISRKIKDSRIVYYADYILEEKEADTLIVSVQNNKYNFKDFMFKVRDKNIRVILLLENAEQKELRDALLLGIYDIIFDPFTLEDICKKIDTPSAFSDIAKYIKDIMELENI